MSYERVTLNDGWKLGWQEDPVFNRWIVCFNSWAVKEGMLVGKPTSYTRGLIYPNCSPAGDYSVEFSFTLSDESSDLRPILCYSITRLAGYHLVLSPGKKASVYYVYSDLYDHAILDDIGPELEAEKEYTLGVARRDNTVNLTLDGVPLGEFECDAVNGNYTALSVLSGEVAIHKFVIKDSGDTPLFQDDFLHNSLPRDVSIDYSELSSEHWIDAVVPGTVQTALLNAGVIEDPYMPFQGEKSHWLNDQRWIYKKSFQIPDQFRGKRLRLLFHGVDYRAHFWINGVPLCYHEGMFGGPELDITNLVNYEDENELAVCILPCPNPPHNNVRPYILHRWHFNMDIITSGLWRGVDLIADDRVYLTDPQVITRNIDENGTATLDLSVTLTTMALWPFDVRGKFTLRFPGSTEEPLSVSFAPGFCQGSLRVKCSLEVPNAKLWWPAGMGEQNLYDVDITVDLFEYQKQAEPTAHDELHLRTGIRTLRLAPAPNQDVYHAAANPQGFLNWYFTVNGRPFFAKGSNWMPIDQMLRLDKDHYRRLLTRVVDSNMNVLRPWGAGLLETDEFYEICDELGICVWQETLFANGIYDQSNLDVWRETMRRNVCRLRNHPSLAVYCGGNEFDPDAPENKDIIDELIAICGELDPSREFRPASPYGGDNHSYLVNWMGGQPYTAFSRDYSVAITEFSLASPPCMDSLRRLISQEDLDQFPPDLPDNIYRYDYTTWGQRKAERKESPFSILDAHLSGITNIMFPPMSDCGKPKNMEEFVSYLQTAQGLLTQFGIDFWRSRWPECTAAMSWVFNVIFPDSMSWSYVDYYQVPKRSYYYQKRAYEQLHVAASFGELFNLPGSTLRINRIICNEKNQSYQNLTLSTRLYNSNLKLLASDCKKVNVRAEDIRHCGSFCYEIPENAADEVLFLCIDLTDSESNLLSRSYYCPRIGTPQERMPYLADGPWIADICHARTHLSASAEFMHDHVTVTVENTGQLPAFEVYVHAPQMDHVLRYSDNCLWLEPGETRTLRIRSFDMLPSQIEISAWNADLIVVHKENNDEKAQ